jgi:hypothetical protein
MSVSKKWKKKKCFQKRRQYQHSKIYLKYIFKKKSNLFYQYVKINDGNFPTINHLICVQKN